MRNDKTAFKAEVYRRGRERVTARKRARKRVLFGSATLTVCLVMFIAITPLLGWWNGDAVNDGEMIAEDGQYTVLLNSENENILSNDSEETVNDAPGYSPPMGDGIGGGSLDCPDAYWIYWVGVFDCNEDSILYRHTAGDRLQEIFDLFAEIAENEQENGSNGNHAGRLETSYRITVMYFDGETTEYVWTDTDWYIAEEGRNVTLTADQYDSLIHLLLENEVN